MYADDIQIYISCKLADLDDTVEKLNSDLYSVYTWCTNHGLKINSNKTKVLCIGNARLKQSVDLSKINVCINNERIEFAKSAKSLGLIIDDELNFEEHAANVTQVCYFKLKMLYKLKSSLNSDMKLKLVQTIVYPYLDYCLCVYFSFLNSKNQTKIQRIQNAALRYTYTFLIFLYKLVHFKCPSYLFNKLVLRSSIHSVNIRNNTYTVPIHSSKKFESSFSYLGPKLLNSVLDLLDVSLTLYKTKVKQRLTVN